MTDVIRLSRRDWDVHPPYLHEAYASTTLRAPLQPLLHLDPEAAELTGPVFGPDAVGPGDNDLTLNANTGGRALGQRITVTGRLLEDDGRPVANALIEIWQANSAGRYRHQSDDGCAPLDPNFIGAGRVLTDANGDYRFTSIHPGAYPWRNHHNAWRPSHIHLSIFGSSFPSRLVTQMYFPGDPLLPLDPIFNSVPCERGRELLIARYDHDVTEPGLALGYRFDIVLRGRDETPMETTR
jgi:protocatechuate 3,4-dioxygenase beta subunit